MEKVPAEARECMALIRQGIVNGDIKVPAQRVIGRQNAGKAIDPKSLLASGTHPCLNKRT